LFKKETIEKNIKKLLKKKLNIAGSAQQHGAQIILFLKW
jgi:hypothetical protein